MSNECPSFLLSDKNAHLVQDYEDELLDYEESGERIVRSDAFCGRKALFMPTTIFSMTNDSTSYTVVPGNIYKWVSAFYVN